MTMKKTWGILILMIMVIGLVACNSESTGENKVMSAEPTEEENAILATTADDSFVFDYETDGAYEAITAQVEKYEKGELIDDKLSEVSLEKDGNKGRIIISTGKNVNGINHPVFHVGISSGGSTGSMAFMDEENDNEWNISGSFQEDEIAIDGEEMTLAGIVYDNSDDDAQMTFRSNFYNDPDEMKKYDTVYIFKVRFVE